MLTIKQKRRELGLTQKQLAEKCGVAKQNVSNWERGKVFPSLYSFRLLAEFFGCQVKDLIDE